jgi:hypothetical protein
MSFSNARASAKSFYRESTFLYVIFRSDVCQCLLVVRCQMCRWTHLVPTLFIALLPCQKSLRSLVSFITSFWRFVGTTIRNNLSISSSIPTYRILIVNVYGRSQHDDASAIFQASLIIRHLFFLSKPW